MISDEADLQEHEGDRDDDVEDAERNNDSIIQIDQANDKTELSSPDSNETSLAVTLNGQPPKGKATRPALKRKLTRVTHTFDIDFEHLGLTLSNGTCILEVIYAFRNLEKRFPPW